MVEGRQAKSDACVCASEHSIIETGNVCIARVCAYEVWGSMEQEKESKRSRVRGRERESSEHQKWNACYAY